MPVQISRSPSADFAPMKSESVLFQPTTKKFCLLNATATFLWNQLDRPRTVGELAGRLCQHFDSVSPAEATRDVEKLIEELRSLECVISAEV